MGTYQRNASVSGPCEASNYDELSMKRSLQFSDSLKDLKDLRRQLYSAAEHFESSYSRHDKKEIVVNTLKDYATKAFINTVDHLGSMTCKVNSLLSEEVKEVAAIELRALSLQQRLQTCERFINHEGLSQQSLMIRTPKHYVRYIIPVSEGVKDEVIRTNLEHHATKKENIERQIPEHDADSASRDTSTSFIRRQQSRTQLTQSFPKEQSRAVKERTDTFSFTKPSSNKKAEKQALSPFRFQLTRSGSLVNRSASPKPTNIKRRYPSEPRRSVSLSTYTEGSRRTDIELYSSKNKRLFKALLSMHKSKKDVKWYRFLDVI